MANLPDLPPTSPPARFTSGAGAGSVGPEGASPIPAAVPGARVGGAMPGPLEAIILMDESGHISFWNDGAQAMFGYSAAEACGREPHALLAPARFQQAYQAGWARFQANGEGPVLGRTLELPARRKSGEEFLVQLCVISLQHDGRRQALAVLRDLTERLRAEAALWEASQLNQRIIACVQEGIIVYGPNLEYRVWNPFMEQLSGFPASAVLGKNPAEVFPFLREAGLLEKLHKTLTEGAILSLDFPFAIPETGRSGWVSDTAAPLRNAEGKIVGVITTVRDVTAHKRGEAALRESQERFAKAFDSNPACMVISEIESGRFIDVNEQCLRMLGYGREEMLGHTSLELGLWADFLERDRGVAELRDRGWVRNRPTNFLTKTGEVRTTLWSAERITLGGREAMLSLIYDDTERQQAEAEQKRLQAQLIQAQKMEAIGQLAGGVAHDFNNILTAILLHLNSLQADQQVAPEMRHRLTELEAEAQRAAALTRQLLMFSRRQVLRSQVFELNSLLGNLVKMLRRLIGEHINLELSGPSADLWLEADPGMVEQVVMNLVVNARDALHHGGRISLRTRLVVVAEDAPQRHPEARPGRFVCLAVSDPGCGMDATTLKHLFEPFFTTKAPGQGTGLGLATVYGIVQQHQGWVEVESTLGQGSTFTVFLPAHDLVPPIPGTLPAPEPWPRGQETLLLVEDEKSVRLATSRLLQQLGYRVLEAENAPQALQLWEVQASEPSLLIADMVMPGGMSGLELAEQLLQRHPRLKAILISGYSAEIVREGLPASARVKFLAKPLTVGLLAKAVRACLDAT